MHRFVAAGSEDLMLQTLSESEYRKDLGLALVPLPLMEENHLLLGLPRVETLLAWTPSFNYPGSYNSSCQVGRRQILMLSTVDPLHIDHNKQQQNHE